MDTYASILLLNKILKEYANKVQQIIYMGNARDSSGQDVTIRLIQNGFHLAPNWNFVLRDLSDGKNPELFDMVNWHVNGLWTEGYSM